MDLPIWERTPRAVPPPLGAPPPIEAKKSRPAAVGVGVARAGHVGSSAGAGVGVGAARARVPRTDAPQTPWGAPVNGRNGAPPQLSQRGPAVPRGIIAGVVGTAIAIAATILVVQSTSSSSSSSTSSAVGPSVPTLSGGPRPSSVPGLSSVPTTLATQSVRPPQHTDQTPLSQALANLSTQPMLSYSGLSPDGRASWQLTVTTDGEAQGELDLSAGKLSVLQVGGRTYFKAADEASVDLLGQLPTGLTPAAVRGKWVAGEGSLEAELPTGLASAENLAATLQSALPARDVSVPSPTASATHVDGAPAVPVTTSAGELYISTSQPYRVLRFVAQSASPGQPTDVETVSQSTANSFLGTLTDQTKTLTDALEFGIDFSYREGPQLDCTDGQCTVEVGGVVASEAESDSIPGPSQSVGADMTATVTVAGQPAGDCEVVVDLPLDIPTNVSCQDPDAASVVQSLRGSGSLGVDISLQFQARVDAEADTG